MWRKFVTGAPQFGGEQWEDVYPWSVKEGQDV